MPANEADKQLASVGELRESGIEGLLTRQTEPAWMTDLRRTAWRAFQSTALPAWRRTDLRQLNLDLFRPSYGSAEVQFGGQEGVIVTHLENALRERPDLLDEGLGEALKVRENAFTLLHSALWRDGVFVYVPRGTVVTEPVRIRYRIPEVGAAIFPHTLIIAEANSSITVVEEFLSEELTDPALCIPATEIIVGQNAEVRYTSIQALQGHGIHIGSQYAELQGRDGRLFWLAGALGGQIQHLDMEIRLTGNGSHADWVGFNFATEQQKLLFSPTLRHVGMHTEGQVNFRTVVDDAAYAVFEGLVKIEKGAQGTNSDLREHALHLGKQARSDSIPGLEIDANDVKAGHGSTSGPIDTEQIFYLRSRGLREEDAIRTIVSGFLSEIIDQIPIDETRERVQELCEAKI